MRKPTYYVEKIESQYGVVDTASTWRVVATGLTYMEAVYLRYTLNYVMGIALVY